MRVLSVWLVLVATPFAYGQSSYDALPQWSASEIVPENLRKGAHHEVEERVTSDGYWNSYRIASDYGTFDASGSLLLRVRIRELTAIAQLKEVNEGMVLGEAAAQSLTETGESVVAAASHPVETAKGVGSGIQRLFGRVKRTSTRTVEQARGSSGTGTSDRVARGTTAVGKSLLGVSRAERRWAEQLDVDPYSRNETLRKELTRVASFEAAGRITTDVIVPIPQLVSLSKDVSDLVWKADPDQLETLNETRLQEIGVSNQTSRAFRLNENYTLTWQTVLIAALDALEGVPGRADFVELAAKADSEEQAAYYTESASLIQKFHEERFPVVEVVRGSTAIVRTSENRIVYLVPADYLVWTEELDVFVQAEQKWMSENYPGAPIAVWLSGEASARALEGMEALGWKVQAREIDVLVE